MSAAHELIERGFEVEVHEKKPHIPGGKARSVPVVQPGQDGRLPLPGEHGFRFFPGFYRHVIDTMKRIPVGRGTAFDNLVPTNRIMIARYDKPPIDTVAHFPRSIKDVNLLLHDIFGGVDTGLTKDEIEFFAAKVWQLMTSCYERRLDEYERVGWWEFTQAQRFSQTYRALLVEGLTRTLVAAKAHIASTKTGGDILLQLIFNTMMPWVNTDRVLNGPTNEVWIDPWLKYLQSKGVKYVFDSKAVRIECSDTSIAGVVVQKDGREETVTGDYYLLATPVEVTAALLSKELLQLDSSLQSLITLATYVSWMNGVQFYLNEDVKINDGHVIYCDSQWALTSISQIQFWNNYNLTNHGNGKVKGVLSVDVSDWDSPGFNGKAAKDCTREEICDEVWAQLERSLNVNGQVVLRKEMREYWHLDSDIQLKSGQETTDREPLLVNHVNSWTLRPEAYTQVPNLFLASDYVKTFTDLATMEGANEAARRAVNSILNASNLRLKKCRIWKLHEPDVLSPLRAHDLRRFNRGLPWKNEFSGLEHFLLRVRRVLSRL